MNTEKIGAMREHIVFIAGLIFGATVMALVALLYAPQPGTELRKRICEWLRDNSPWIEKQEWITTSRATPPEVATPSNGSPHG